MDMPACPQDPDSSVREAASEALALVAQGLAEAAPAAGAGGAAGGGPVVKLLFDSLAEQKKELCMAACAALGLVRAAGDGALAGGPPGSVCAPGVLSTSQVP